MKKVYRLNLIRVSLLLFSFILTSLGLSAQCQLSCFGSSNLSLNSSCTATMTTANALANASASCGELTVQVFDENNVLLPTSPTITGAYIGQTVTVAVTEVASGICCHSTIFIEDKTPPQLTCNNDTISCIDEIPMATATDNCGIPDITFTEFREELNCNTGDFTFLVTRLYTATDAQGMTATCIQQVHIRKPTAADIIFPPDFDGFDQPMLDCSTPNADLEITGQPTFNGQPITDACRLFAYSVDDTTFVCEGTIKIFREWKVADWCTSSFLAQATQFIKIQDSTGPTIVCPDSIIIGTDFDVCAATVTLPLPTATDNCSSTDSISFAVAWEFGDNFDPTPGVPLGSHIVTYIATDDCGNTSSCTMTVTVEDDDPPNVTCESSRTVGLSQDSTKFCAIDLFDDGSNDNCTAVLDSFCIRRLDNPVFSDCIVFTCDDLGAAPVMVEFKVCDEAGNCSFCISEVIVMDNQPPVISFCPANTTLSCTAYPADTTVTGSPIAEDACGIANISFIDVEDIDNCNAGTVTRTFTVTGTDGLSAICQQVITFDSGNDPVYTFPEPAQVECLAGATTEVTGFPTATDDCSNLFFIGSQDQVITLIENCRYTISRTFTIANDCDDSLTTGVQIIEVEDNTAPVFDASQNSVTYSCLDEVVSFIPTATDNCNSVVAVALESSVTTPGTCPDNFTRTETYIATDACGNVSAPFVYTITVNDDIAPTADPLPPLGPFACIADIPTANISNVTGVTDNCNAPVTVTIVGTEAPTICSDSVIRTYRITDRCGNFSDLLQTITINDEIPPTADALSDLGPFSCAEDITDPNINDVTGATDNCNGPVTVSFLNQTTGNNCDNTFIRTYRLTDECGNTSDIDQNIILNDMVAPTADQPAALTGIECFDEIPAGSATDLSNISDNCIGTVVVTIDDSGLVNPGCSGTLNRIYVLTDDCGNTSTITREIQIDDQTAPTWDQVPGGLDMNTDCAENINFTAPTATDNCNNATITLSSDVISDMTCDHRFTRTVTYVATDDCSNVSEPFVITITVFDDEAPTANPLADAGPFNCIDDFPINIQSVTNLFDNCAGEVTVRFVDDTAPPLCMGAVVRTYEISDICGNTREITQNILIEDTTAPTADALADIGPFSCVEDITDPNINEVTGATDNCAGSVTVSFFNQTINGDCSNALIRTYRLTDACGNTSDVNQNILLNDNIAPTADQPTPLTNIECVDDIPAGSAADLSNISDNCIGTIDVTIDDSDLVNSICSGTLNRVYILTDNCGNTSTVTQEIQINDQTAPTWNQIPGDLDINTDCAGNVNLIAPTATDNCNNATVTVLSDETTDMTCDNQFTRTVIYVATDDCMNASEPFVITITVLDDEAPMAGPMADAGPFDCITDFPNNPNSITNITDNCIGLVSVRFISDTDAPMCMGTVVRTYELSDICGNTRQVTQNILIEDTSFPTADPLADLGPFTCTDQIPAPDISVVMNAQDNCGETVTVSFLNEETPDRCNGSFIRTYQVSDQCGHTTNITQTIIINDNVAPQLIDPLISGSYDCAVSVPDSILNFAAGVDNCGGDVTSELLPDDSSFRPLQCLDTLFQSFRLTDVCGNETIAVRQILILDDVPPVFVDAPGSLDTMVQCATDPINIIAPTAMDACRFIDAVRVASIDTISFTCTSGYTERIGFVATDACGNQTPDTFFVEVVVNDTTPPEFTFLQKDTMRDDTEPFPMPLVCGEDFFFETEATDNCNGLITYRSQIIEANGSVINLNGPTIDRDFATGENTVTFFAEDACGNIATDTFTVMVVDVTSPAYSCIPGLQVIDVDEDGTTIFADQFVSIFRECSATNSATFASTGLPSMFIDCDLLDGESSTVIIIQIFLSDVLGNVSIFPCGVQLLINNVGCNDIQMATVAGELIDETGNGVDDVVVEIAGPVISQRVESAYGGTYFLPNLEMYEDYQIIPYRNDDLLNGISTMDLILLGEHLLEISTLDSPYQLIAADINNDGAVTALDMIALRRAILIIDEEFQNNTSWRFVDSEFEFPEPTNPFTSSFPESRFVHDLSTNEMVNDFMAIKVGDLNGTAASSGLQAGDTRSEEVLSIKIEDQILEAGELYELSFSSDNFVDLKGFQFTIDYNPLAISPEFENKLSNTLNNFNEQNIGFTQLENGLLSVSWHDTNPVTLANRGEVFTFSFRAKIDTRLSSVLQFNDALLRAESYTSDLQTQKVQLEYEGDLIDNNTDTEFALLQNQPNPFRQQTVIPFILPKAGKTKIEITDINGRIIAEYEAFYEAGYQELVVDKSELNAGGVLFYHLQSGKYEATRKMVVIE